jgi:hypothetical protein
MVAPGDARVHPARVRQDLPALRGFAAFGRGDYRSAIDELLPLRGKANRFGGSHAQRDAFSWTLTEAALRSGDSGMAAALLAERLALKPQSRVNADWCTRAAALTGRRAA